jgi:UDP-N-acetylglucosamine 1-carboxyvinyltransferase
MGIAKLIPIYSKRRDIPTIHVAHAKNSILPLLVASTILDGPTTFKIEDDYIQDVQTVLQILEYLGASCTREKSRLIVDPRALSSKDMIPKELSAKTRYSLLLLGALGARFGYCRIPTPGGCDLSRPYDFHIRALQDLGYSVHATDVDIYCEKSGQAKSTITLPYPSVGATLQLIIASVMGPPSEPITICNAAREPEIEDVIAYLSKSGAKIVRDTFSITVFPVGSEALRGVEYEPMRDRIEAGSYAFAAAALRKELLLKDCPSAHMESTLSVLRALNCRFYLLEGKDILVDGRELYAEEALEVTTGPYPLFPTDLQPILAALCCTLTNQSVITDAVMPHRTRYVPEMQKLGALIESFGNRIVVSGMHRSEDDGPATVVATDLRGGMALIVLGLSLGKSAHIHSFSQVLRGYSRVLNNTHALGGRISHVS